MIIYHGNKHYSFRPRWQILWNKVAKHSVAFEKGDTGKLNILVSSI